MARVAIVTGGTRGIGEAISLALRDAGMTVAANYAGNEERARAFTERTGIKAYKWDVSDFDACLVGAQQVEAELGPADVLVNNAGITRDGTMKRMNRQAWEDVIDTNLGGCFNMAKAVWDGMNARKYGRIVNIGSINGQAGQYGQVNYAAAKSGIHGFTKALAQEGARAGITVNAIAPGYIDTDMVAAVPPEVLEKIVAKIPVGRLGKAEEIARGVVFLCGEDAGFVTGSTLSINGGQHMYCRAAATPRRRRCALAHRPARPAGGPGPARPTALPSAPHPARFASRPLPGGEGVNERARQTVDHDRRPSDLDQPGAGLLVRAGRSGGRCGPAALGVGCPDRRRADRCASSTQSRQRHSRLAFPSRSAKLAFRYGVTRCA